MSIIEKFKGRKVKVCPNGVSKFKTGILVDYDDHDLELQVEEGDNIAISRFGSVIIPFDDNDNKTIATA